MTDAIEIDSLLNPTESYIPSYQNEQWAYIQDYNNNNYQSQIQFTTNTLLARKVVWRDAYVTIPLVLASSGSAYTSTTKLALKNSVLSMMYGIQVNTIGGQTIVNAQQIQFINQMRLLLETNADWLTSEAAELQFGKDSTVWPNKVAKNVAELPGSIAVTGLGVTTFVNTAGTVTATPTTGTSTYSTISSGANARDSRYGMKPGQLF